MRSLFRVLDGAEEQEFRDWARSFHKPGQVVNPLWHPVVRDECARIDGEWAERCAEELFQMHEEVTSE